MLRVLGALSSTTAWPSIGRAVAPDATPHRITLPTVADILKYDGPGDIQIAVAGYWRPGDDGALTYESTEGTNSSQLPLLRDRRGRPWRPVPAPSYSVAQFGARGDGLADDLPSIQNCIDTLAAYGGGTAVFPTDLGAGRFFLGRPIVCRPRVSLAGYGNAATLVSSRTESTVFSGAVLLPGNFHPDFTNKLRTSPLTTCTPGTKITLATNEHIDDFEVGDQIIVLSNASLEMGGFPIPEYAFLNYITERQGRSISLATPIDKEFQGKIGLLKHGTARGGIPLFFYSDAEVRDLHMESTGTWISDSATLRVDFRGITTQARSGAYGNLFQHTKWQACTFNFFGNAIEQSHNSLNSLIEDCAFNFKPRTDFVRCEGISIQEFSRQITIRNCVVRMGEFPSGGPALRILNAQDVAVQNVKFSIDSMKSGSVIYMGHAGTQSFAVSGNHISDCDFTVGSAGRFVYIKGGDSPYMFDNEISNCRFIGTLKAADAFRFEQVRGKFSFNSNTFLTNNIQQPSSEGKAAPRL